VGDLIAVRDPRGCGQNFFYDHAGRLMAEDYVECDEVMPAGTQPTFPLPASAIAEGEIGSAAAQLVDARYYFDEEPEFTGGFVSFLYPTPHWVGRGTGSLDRAQASVAVYDARGQAEASIRIMSVLPEARTLDATLPEDLDDDGVGTTPAPSNQTFDFTKGYSTLTKYEYLGRPVEMTYPDNADWNGTSTYGHFVRGSLRYNRLGLPTGVDLVRNITYDANRLPTRIDLRRRDRDPRPTRGDAVRRAPACPAVMGHTRHRDGRHGPERRDPGARLQLHLGRREQPQGGDRLAHRRPVAGGPPPVAADRWSRCAVPGDRD